MLDSRIREYLTQIGIRRVRELDTALLETFGPGEGERHIERLTELFDQSEERLLYGTGETPYLRRQGELVDYLNQSLEMSLLAASFYDSVFFRRVMEYLLEQDSFFTGDICDFGCGNGILTCFLARQHPDSAVTGLELSSEAVRVAQALAGQLRRDNVRFVAVSADAELVYGIENRNRRWDTLFSCRTVHENIAMEAIRSPGKGKPDMPSAAERTERYAAYAGKLAAMARSGGHLVSVEHYEDDSAYAGLTHALERAGFSQVKGTGMQFSCKNGDRTAVFGAMVFRKK